MSVWFPTPDPTRRLPQGVVLPERHAWPVELRCGPVVLRPLRRRDAGDWQQVRHHNAAWNAPWDATRPDERPGLVTHAPGSFARMVAHQQREARAGRMLPFAICWDPAWPAGRSRASRLGVRGQMTVSGITYGSAQFAHAGYWVDEALAGRGVTPTALALVTDYCFQVMGLHRMEVNIRPENAKSLRVVEKLGWRSEGMRPRYLHIDGDWRDHESFTVLDEEVPEGMLNRWLQRRRDGFGEAGVGVPRAGGATEK